MNHNFVDWEITQLLPEYNSYSLINWIWYDSEYFLDFKEKENLEPELEYYYCIHKASEVRIKDAWTFEDVRLYLKEKGFEICLDKANLMAVQRLGVPNKWKMKILHNTEYVELDNSYKHKFYDTYEEARREAIKYCLTLINK